MTCPTRKVTPQTMKRFSYALVCAVAFSVLAAPSALAAAGYPESPSASVEGTSGSAGGTAFTGAGGGVSMATVWIVVLVVAGVTALFVARRRAARLTSG
jgi:hypothetical protein